MCGGGSGSKKRRGKIFHSSSPSSLLLVLVLLFSHIKNLKKTAHKTKKKMNFVDGDKRPTNTGGIDDTVKLAAGKMDALVGMDEDGDMQKDYTWDCVIFGDGS